jgi:threonine dehydrogenase-like Zn-dependent dehydrogenase
MAHTQGVVALFGVLRDSVAFGFDHWRRGLHLIGYGRHNRVAAEKALALILQGQLQLAPLSTCALPLTRYAEGVELLRARRAVKIRFLPWDEE